MSEEIAKSMTLLPEYQEKFLKDLLANVYQVDEKTGMITGIAAKSPLEGTPRVDAQGNPIYKRDAQGNIMKDQFGDPVQEFEGGVPSPEVIRFTDPQRKALEMGQAGIGAYKPLMAEAEKTLGAGLGAYQQGVSTLGGTTAAFDPMSYKDYYDPFVNEVISATEADIRRGTDIERQRINTEGLTAGAFGGSRQAVAEQELQRNAADQMARTGAQLRSAAYTGAQQQAQSVFQNLMERGQNAAQAFGQLGQGIGNLGVQQGQLGEAAQSLGQKDVNALFNIGSLEQTQLQGEYDVGRQAALEQAYEPFARFSYMRDILSGIPSSQTTLSTTGTPRMNPAGEILNMANTMSQGSSGSSFGLGSLRNPSGA
jgi:hypothetical protein